MKPAISVIVPVYRVEKYLAECLDSLLVQTFSDFDVICIDDGSDDGCAALLTAYSLKDSRFRVVSHRNGGLSDARNLGLDLADGKYIIFLDSDDFLLPEALERSFSSAEEKQTDILCFNAVFYDEETKRYDRAQMPVVRDNREVKSGVIFYEERTLDKLYAPAIWHKIYRNDFLRKNRIRFVRGILYEDRVFTPQAYLAAERVAGIPDYLYVYRIRHGSIMRQLFRYQHLYSMVHVILEQLSFVERFREHPALVFYFVQTWNTFHIKVRDGMVKLSSEDLTPFDALPEWEKRWLSLLCGDRFLLDGKDTYQVAEIKATKAYKAVSFLCFFSEVRKRIADTPVFRYSACPEDEVYNGFVTCMKGYRSLINTELSDREINESCKKLEKLRVRMTRLYRPLPAERRVALMGRFTFDEKFWLSLFLSPPLPSGKNWMKKDEALRLNRSLVLRFGKYYMRKTKSDKIYVAPYDGKKF